jgi:DNA primase
MTNWIDIKELRKQLDFGKVLQHYGVELKLTGDQHHGFCPLPLHNGKKNSPSFSANLKRGIWQCFGCGKKGNVLDFAVLMEGANPKKGEDVRRVALELNERFLSDEDSALNSNNEENNEISPLSEEDEVVVNRPLDFKLKGLDASHPYLLKRGFTAETIKDFGLGYCSRGLLRDRIAIPLQDAEGKLLGYAGRVVDDKTISEDNPKYKLPGRRERKGITYEFKKSLLLYNTHRIAGPVQDLIVVEGFASVWWLTQAGIPNVVALMGASCSSEQARIISALVPPEGCVWIFTDGDAGGERCAEDIFLHIATHCAIRWARLEDVEQPTDFRRNILVRLFPFLLP